MKSALARCGDFTDACLKKKIYCLACTPFSQGYIQKYWGTDPVPSSPPTDHTWSGHRPLAFLFIGGREKRRVCDHSSVFQVD